MILKHYSYIKHSLLTIKVDFCTWDCLDWEHRIGMDIDESRLFVIKIFMTNRSKEWRGGWMEVGVIVSEAKPTGGHIEKERNINERC